MPIEQLNKDEKGKLYLGILHLLDVNGDLEQSINLLEELRVANSNYYPRGSSYLITALVLNGKVDRARELYEEDKAKNGLSDEALAPNILNRINSN